MMTNFGCKQVSGPHYCVSFSLISDHDKFWLQTGERSSEGAVLLLQPPTVQLLPLLLCLLPLLALINSALSPSAPSLPSPLPALNILVDHHDQDLDKVDCCYYCKREWTLPERKRKLYCIYFAFRKTIVEVGVSHNNKKFCVAIQSAVETIIFLFLEFETTQYCIIPFTILSSCSLGFRPWWVFRKSIL